MESIINENKNDNIKEENSFGDLIEYEEYYLIKENCVYKFIIGKKKKEIIIKCKNYELILNNKDLSTLTKTNLNTIDDSYLFIINEFEQNSVIIESIISGKTISLILKIKNQKDCKIILSHNKKSKDLLISELNNNYNKMKKDIDNLNNEINLLKNEIFNLKKMIMDKNNGNMGGINMNMNNNKNWKNQMGGMNNNMNTNMMNQMGGMYMNMNMMNLMGEIKIDDDEGLNLVFENQDDKEIYNIKISPDRYLIEAFNRYKIKSGREGEMNFFYNNKYLFPDDKISYAGLLDLSRILVVRDDDDWTLIFENQEYKDTCNIKISGNKTLEEAFNLYKLKTLRNEKMTFLYNYLELPYDLKISKSGVYNLSRIIIPSKWTLIFENQDDKKTINIRIEPYEKIQEAFNKYKIKSGRSGKMKFITESHFDISGCTEFKINSSYLSDQSKILVYFS